MVQLGPTCYSLDCGLTLNYKIMYAGVVFTYISAYYYPHKILAVHKIMEVMSTVYTKVGLSGKLLLKCFIHFSISFHWYTFPNFRTQICCPLTWCVCISSKASATTVYSIIAMRTYCCWFTAVVMLVWMPFQCKTFVTCSDFFRTRPCQTFHMTSEHQIMPKLLPEILNHCPRWGFVEHW